MHVRAEWDRLLAEARAGDADALARLVEAAGEDLMAVAAGVLHRTTRARLPADEVFSHAVLAVLREVGHLRASSYIGFRFWFASIARNHVRRELRESSRRARPGIPGEPAAGTPGPVEGSESRGPLRATLRRLPHRQQLAFVLREGFALPWGSIGFVLERRGSPAARLIHYRAMAHVLGAHGAQADGGPAMAPA